MQVKKDKKKVRKGKEESKKVREGHKRSKKVRESWRRSGKVEEGAASHGKSKQVKKGQRRSGNIRECREAPEMGRKMPFQGRLWCCLVIRNNAKTFTQHKRALFSECSLLHHVQDFVTYPSFLIALSEHNNNLWFLLENHLPKIIPSFWQWSLGCNVFLGWIITLKEEEIGPAYQHAYCFGIYIFHVFYF